jgi:oligopeptide transport system substrate-binding protein
MERYGRTGWSQAIIAAAAAAWTAAVASTALPATELPDWKRACEPRSQTWRETPQHFVFNNESEPETLDLHAMTGSPELRLALALFEGLTTLDPRTLEPRPGLAEAWTMDSSGRRFTFTLRPNLRWSDGRPLTADDFVASWRRALTPATGCSYAGLFFVIDGAEAWHRAPGADFASVGVRAPDARTLEVTLRAPCAYFLELTAFATFSPVRADLIAAHGEAWTRAGRLVGSGPFVLAEWDPRRQIRMTPNTNYWDAAFVKLTSVTALPLDDQNTAYQMFLKGGIHWLPGIPQARAEEIRRHPDYYVAPFFGTYFYRFNTTREPFNDARVRRAFSLATDRREITDHILKSGQLPVASFCPPVGGYEPVDGLPYDRDAARDLLAQAGYGPGGRPFPPVEVLYNTSEGHKLTAEAVSQQWRRNLGIAATARNVEWKVFLTDMRDLDYQLCRASWIGDYGDPSTFFDIFRGDDGNNRTGWKNAVYDRLSREAAEQSEPGRRWALYQRMEQILTVEECPILPLYRYVNQGLLSPMVCGWYANIRDVHNYKYMWLTRE